VFFSRGVHGIGDELLHWLVAADGKGSRELNHSREVAAMPAPEKFLLPVDIAARHFHSLLFFLPTDKSRGKYLISDSIFYV
jgi:hypothetical protein